MRMMVSMLNQRSDVFGTVRLKPDVCQHYTGVEPEEDCQGKAEVHDDDPWKQSIVLPMDQTVWCCL